MQIITKIGKKLNIIALEHVFIPRVWVLDPVECAKSACFGSGHRSDQECPFPFAVHFSLQLALRDSPKHEVTFFDLPWSDFLVAPPSSLLLVSVKVFGYLDLDGFDGVNG